MVCSCTKSNLTQESPGVPGAGTLSNGQKLAISVYSSIAAQIASFDARLGGGSPHAVKSKMNENLKRGLQQPGILKSKRDKQHKCQKLN